MKDKSASQRAEAEAQPAQRGSPVADSALTAGGELHELRLHQTELESQNENLRQTRIGMEKSRDRYADLYDFAPAAYLTISREGLIFEANLTCAALFGVEHKKLIQHRFDRFVAVNEQDRWQLFFLNVLQGSEQQSCELALKRGDGSVFYARLDCRHMETCGVSSLRIVLFDVTQESMAFLHRYNSLFENISEGYAYCRMLFEHGIPQDFIYLEVNNKFEKLTGLKDVVGKKVSEIIPGIRGSNPELFEIFGRVALTGQPEKIETYVDALGIWFSISVHSQRKEHFVTVFDNITERKRIDQELIVLNNHLAHEVAKRTADLSALTAQVQQVAEQEKASVARELHDELGSTLVGICMEVGRLKEKISAPDILQDLSVIKDLVSNATLITRGVINQLYPTVLDTCGFAAAVEWLVKEFRKHSEIEVELFLPEEQIDMEQTFALAAYRITQECLTNIAKHAGASKVHIEAKISEGFLDLTIHDNGKGLSDGTNTGGNGIFGMVERARYLGGVMEIGSDGGKGTTAHLRLPLAVAKPKNKKRVLVVDDHAIVRDALRQLLDSQTDDFTVEGEASDGNTAVEMAIDGVWDVMLLDINLPKKNGMKVLEEIMTVKSNLPIIMLSSHAVAEYAEIALAKGAAGYIEKGETSKLVEAMRRATLLT